MNAPSPKYGWCWDEDGNHEVGCGNLDLPHTEFEDVKGKKPDCFQYWFSDWGSSFGLEGEPTIPEEMRQPEVSCVHQAGASGRPISRNKFDWSQNLSFSIYRVAQINGPNGGVSYTFILRALQI